MRTYLLSFFLILMLDGCHRSPEPLYYVLQPLTPPLKLAHHHLDKVISIEEVSMPAYVNKLPLVIQYAPNQVLVSEHNLWAEELSKNVTRLLQTNLSLFLPEAIILRAPWTAIQIHPAYRVQVSVLQFTLDTFGSASLAAEYLIYDQAKLIMKGHSAYSKQILPFSFASLVQAMNENLTCLSRDLARDLAR